MSSFVKSHLIAIFFIAAGIFLRFFHLTSMSMEFQELYNIGMIVVHGPLELVEYLWTIKETHPPLQHLILQLFMKMFGEQEFVLHLPSVLAGSFSLVAIYMITSKLFNRHAAVLALIFMAFNYSPIFHSQEVRNSSLFILSSLCFFYYGSLFWKRELNFSEKLGFCFWGTVLIYNHFGGVPFFLFISGIIYFKKIIKYGVSKLLNPTIIVAFLLSIPCLYLIVNILSTSAGSRTPIDWYPAVQWDFPFKLITYAFGTVENIVFFVVAVLFLIWYLISFIRKGRKNEDHQFLFLCLVVPVLILTIISIATSPLIMERIVIFYLPLIYIVISLGIASLLAKSRLPFVVVQIAVGLALLYHLLVVADYYHRPSMNYRRLSHEVITRIEEKDKNLIVGDFFTGYNVLHFYLGPLINNQHKVDFYSSIDCAEWNLKLTKEYRKIQLVLPDWSERRQCFHDKISKKYKLESQFKGYGFLINSYTANR